jgi:hypothetical protein
MELMTYEFINIDDPLGRKSRWIGGVKAFLNLDGVMVEMEVPQLGGSKLSGNRTSKSETAAFRMPLGTLQKIVDARLPKLRIVGTDCTCDGTVEPNMRLRMRSLLDWMRD